MSGSSNNRRRRQSDADEASNVAPRNPYAKKTPTNITPTNPLTHDSRQNSQHLQINVQRQHRKEQPLDEVQRQQLPKQQRRMDQMIILRDSKRQRMTELFDDLQGMKNQRKELDKMISSKEKNMEELEKELMKLDDDIEEISDELHQQEHLQSSNEVHQEQEPLPSSLQCENTDYRHPQGQPLETLPPAQPTAAVAPPPPQPLTMNPDEHLPDPLSATQNMTQTQALAEEFLTDPAMTASSQPWQYSSDHPVGAVAEPEEKQRQFHDEPQWHEDPGWTEQPQQQEQEPPSPYESTDFGGTNGILPRLDIVTTTETAKRSPTNPSSLKQNHAEPTPQSSGSNKKRRASVGMATLDGYFTAPNPPKRNRHSTGTAATAASTIEPTDLTMDDDDDFDGVGHGMQSYIPQGTVATRPFSSPPPAAAASQQQRNNDTNAFAPWTQQQVYSLLEQRFQIQSFRDKQEAIIQSTLRGRDVFVIMRTGGGKSLTYQLPALLEGRMAPQMNRSMTPYNKVTFVISPLLSLITDQVDQMNAFMPGSALSFTSKMKGGTNEHARRWQLVRDPNGGVCLVFVTPEKVNQSGKLKSELQKLYEQGRLGRIVIDECHCACQWGHDFRPDYAKLGVLKRYFPSVPVLAVTATASDGVRNDCIKIFGMDPNRHDFYRSTANRPNLRYQVRTKEDASSKNNVIDDMAAFIKGSHPHGAGIVYTYSKKDADTVADQLCNRGIVARSYHSHVSATQKDLVHRSWMRNETQVVVATIAFGLGINKPDVRFVLHHTLSKTLEAYYQESGRAGRDGNPADCILYFSPKDVPRMIKMIHGESSERVFWKMVSYAQAFGNDAVCRARILNCLGEPNSPDIKRAMDENVENVTIKDVAHHAKTVLTLLRQTTHAGSNVTMHQLVKEWRTKPDSAAQCVKNNPPGKDLSVSECERIVVALLEYGCITTNIKFGAYDSIVYLICTADAQLFCASDKAKFSLRVPKREGKKTASRGSATASSARKAAPKTSAGKKAPKKSPGTTKKQTAKRPTKTKKQTTGKGRAKKSTAKTGKSTVKPKSKPKTNAKKKGKSTPTGHAMPSIPAAIEIIELDDSSESESENRVASTASNAVGRRSSRRKQTEPVTYEESPVDDENLSYDDDSENEF